MKTRFLPFFALAIFLVVNACTTSYSLGNFSSESTYVPRPMNRDSVNKAFHVGGQYQKTLDGYVYNPGESSEMFALNASHARVDQNHHSSWGGFAYTGTYEVRAVEPLRGPKKFWGAGLQGEIGYNFPKRNFDFRPLGVRATLIYEGGAFSQFRKDAVAMYDGGLIDDSITNENPDNLNFNLSLTNEIVWKHKNFDIGYSLIFGRNLTRVTAGHNLYLNSDHFVFSLSATGSVQSEELWSGGTYYGLSFFYKLW